MWLSPSLILMLISILTSVLLVFSSPSLLISWVGLELNTLVFLPLMLMKKYKMSSEASIKYFLTQTLASILIVIGALSFFLNISLLGNGLVLLGLAIKLGVAPFHSWVLSVAEGLGWGVLFILLTIQKINPLIMMHMFIENFFELTYFLIMLTLVVGGLMGLIHTSPRLLLTFSSINHMGWMLTGFMYNFGVGVSYFIVYSIVLLPVMMVFSMFNISHINELFLINFPKPNLLMLFLPLLSLGGLPPFLGFLPKWVVLQFVLGGGYYLLSLVMILASLFTLFFYLRMMFSAFIMSGVKLTLLKHVTSLSTLNLSLLGLSLLGLPLYLLI